MLQRRRMATMGRVAVQSVRSEAKLYTSGLAALGFNACFREAAARRRTAPARSGKGRNRLF